MMKAVAVRLVMVGETVAVVMPEVEVVEAANSRSTPGLVSGWCRSEQAPGAWPAERRPRRSLIFGFIDKRPKWIAYILVPWPCEHERPPLSPAAHGGGIGRYGFSPNSLISV